MNVTKLSEKYQIVVPKKVREMMKLKVGQRVYITPVSDTQAMLVREPLSHTEALAGLGSEVWEKLGGADAYIKKERSSWDK